MNDFYMQYIFKYGELILRLFLSVICGCMIGYERKNRKKEAGIRTHIIVCVASCLMMEISKYGFSDIVSSEAMRADGSRIASQIVSGIGFLGAGMIFVHKNSIKGLTTAAGIWATSGIGMAIGSGMYFIGIVTTVMIVLLQVVLHKNIKFLRNGVFETIIFEVANNKEVIDDVRKVLESNSLTVENISLNKTGENKLKLSVDVSGFESVNVLSISNDVIDNEMIYSVYTEN